MFRQPDAPRKAAWLLDSYVLLRPLKSIKVAGVCAKFVPLFPDFLFILIELFFGDCPAVQQLFQLGKLVDFLAVVALVFYCIRIAFKSILTWKS